MLPGARTSAIAVADGQVIEWDGAGLGDLTDLAIDEGVGAVDPGRHDVGITGIDDGQHLERLDIELERIDRPARVLRLPDGPRPEPGA